MQTVALRTGRKPVIDTGNWFWRGCMGNPTGFAAYPLWAAPYNNYVDAPGLSGNWKPPRSGSTPTARTSRASPARPTSAFSAKPRPKLAVMADGAW